MSIETPQDSLQHYFDDLLLLPEEAEVNIPPKVVLKPQVDEAKQLPRYQYDEQREKEQLAQKKLAKLLASSAAVEIETTVEPIESVLVDPVLEKSVTTISSSALSVPELGAVVSIPETENALDEVVESGASEEIMAALEWMDNGRPCWAQSRFDVLLFTVSGLTLAVPLIALGQIQPITDELTPLFGQADWFMGIQPTAVGKIRTINTSKFVMPERYDESFLKTAKYVVSIDGLPWGLAVDAVNQPISLEPEDVKWRSERSKRAWLAGTVKQHMCALIDIPMMGKLLQDSDKSK
jgi:purine-binding chemotaxis protein CheW